ncbi:MAG: ATP-binding protein [Anaerolineae bacterium]
MTVFRDLCQHILDIYENSARADAQLVRVEITEDFREDRLSITVTDDGRGMDKEMVQRIADPWTTTRTTRNVGLGIPFLKQTAEMCGGHFELQSAPGEGTRVHATFEHSHIDRPPLGDLVATLMCMIVGYPQVDLVYRHRVIPAQAEERTFTLDTREIRAVLGDEVPLSDPAVLRFLRTRLEEGMQSLAMEPLPSRGAN